MKNRGLLFHAVAASTLIAAPVGAQPVVVNSGDTLSSIAARELGDEHRWPALCEANRDILRNCDLLPVGITLQLPTDTALPEIESPVAEGTSSEAQATDAGSDTVSAAGSLIVNGDFSDGLSGWTSVANGTVGAEVQDEALQMTRSGEGIDGAPTQILELEPGAAYELRVSVLEQRIGYVVRNTDKTYLALPKGDHVITVIANAEGPYSISFWPYGTGMASVDDVALIPRD